MLKLITKGIKKVFGTKSEKDVKELTPYVIATNEEYAKLHDLSNDEFRAKTWALKERIKEALKPITDEIAELKEKAENDNSLGIDEKERIFKKIDELTEKEDEELEVVLLEILPEAFAIVKETAKRFKENDQLTVTATHLDRELATKKEHIIIEGDKANWKNEWRAAGNLLKWDMLHYDVQIIGGAALHKGNIAEMQTGEGKTLVATFPAFLNALAGKGVHIVTVNDYLARRDSEWMAPIFEFHGLTCDCIDKYQPNSQDRRAAYAADICYGTNNEFGFDYLRDNMVSSPKELVQRKHHFAMIDEVDSVLIDDARTPLIISGPMAKKGDEALYMSLKPRVAQIVEAQKTLANNYLNEAKKLIKEGNLKEAGLPLFRAYRGLPKSKPLIKFLSETGNKKILLDTEAIHIAENNKLMPQADEPLFFTIDEKHKSVELTDKGLDFLTGHDEDPDFFVIPDLSVKIDEIDKSDIDEQEKILKKDELVRDYATKAERIHAINQLLKAYCLFETDVDYVLIDGKVKIVDEQTGRVMDGRRWSDGLHQAVEAKENVKVEDSTQTYATITLQNYFRMYHKLAGMTGTAETEAGEFWKIYKLDVVSIPTNRPVVREDLEDKVYKTVREKYNAVADEINDLVEGGRPVLVGTTSVENSEIMSKMLSIRKIPHQVLNAKQHAREADIVAEAGKPGTVTIATNMAGRGTDIKLTPESKGAGGLAIIGTERHESRRVDRQLRGRSGRQGDPGSSQFFVSLEDSLMRLFFSDRTAKIMDKLGMEDGEVIQHSMITNSIERAQTKVEENNFGMRKRLIEYDDVMNIQRDTIYKRRKNALYGDRLSLDIANILYDTCHALIANASGNYDEFEVRSLQTLGFKPEISRDEFAAGGRGLESKLYDLAQAHYDQKNEAIAQKTLPVLQKVLEDRSALQGEHFLAVVGDGTKNLAVFCDMSKTIDSNGKLLIKEMEKAISLGVIDQQWKEHLRDMDDLKQSVQNASYEQKDPLLIYKFEAVELFQNFLTKVNADTISFLMKAGIVELRFQQVAPPKQDKPELSTNRADSDSEAKGPVMPVKSQKVASRNERVNVQYKDGSVKRDVKFKYVEADVINGQAVLVD
ncbi:preprotein translocase subunit SecA [Marinilongibacter aquaticus]|uniref:preprotein translocase subunit SecA n=1 Tax=Marinilongibacter aquaticus TaxID=2975157 RepID=UPI0021BD4B4D|nr:preprotein translocase subunit SecA [Marinilongibacter aquaticus]UBM57866.1 preprotein translocase subunit SecA [Marinilongibacter aquaticus]